MVSNCLGQEMPPPEVAPSLSSTIREGLQGKRVSPENVELHLKQIRSLSTYEKAFQQLWLFCVEKGGDPLHMSKEEVASWILRLAQGQPHQGCND
jgi:hypothetical protein